jgi:hypothetical protein
VRAPVALVALLMGAVACAAPNEAPQTAVTVEVFAVAVAGAENAGLEYTRLQGRLEGGLNPDDRARGLASQTTDELRLIHSTSWRWEPDGRIVLTYLAWAGDGGLKGGARPLPAIAPPGPTDPLHPRPAEIAELDPLAHGLRHLAFLLRTGTDGSVADAIGPRACEELKRFEPTVAGEM